MTMQHNLQENIKFSIIISLVSGRNSLFLCCDSIIAIAEAACLHDAPVSKFHFVESVSIYVCMDVDNFIYVYTLVKGYNSEMFIICFPLPSAYPCNFLE